MTIHQFKDLVVAPCPVVGTDHSQGALFLQLLEKFKVVERLDNLPQKLPSEHLDLRVIRSTSDEHIVAMTRFRVYKVLTEMTSDSAVILGNAFFFSWMVRPAQLLAGRSFKAMELKLVPRTSFSNIGKVTDGTNVEDAVGNRNVEVVVRRVNVAGVPSFSRVGIRAPSAPSSASTEDWKANEVCEPFWWVIPTSSTSRMLSRTSNSQL